MIICENKNQCDCLANMNIEATVDNSTGTPSVAVTKNNDKIVFAFSGLKGATGKPGLNGTDGQQGDPGLNGKTGGIPKLGASAHIGHTIGEPNVEVQVSGTDEQPVFNFTFNGIRGNDGHDGKNGIDGRDGKDGIDVKAEDVERAIKAEMTTQLEQMDADLQALSWLNYAINGYENDKQAFARLVAAARDYKDSGKTKLDEAYAGVNALVEKLLDGSYKATSFLTSLVGSNDGEGGSSEGWSGVITSADIHDAMVDVFANYTNDANTMTARIFALANADGSAIRLKADRIDLQGLTWADVINLDEAIFDNINIEKDPNNNDRILTDGSFAVGNYLTVGEAISADMLNIAGDATISGGINVGSDIVITDAQQHSYTISASGMETIATLLNNALTRIATLELKVAALEGTSNP